MKYIDSQKRNIEKFKDVEFPPHISSLINLSTFGQKKERVKLAKYNEWKSILTIYPKKSYFSVTKYINPFNIEQGSIKSCSILSALTALASKP